MARPDDIKAALDAYRADAASVYPHVSRTALAETFAEDATLHLCFPFNDRQGPEALEHMLFQPLRMAMPDLERRDMIVMAGTTPEGQDWVGTMGNYMGTLVAPFLDIPPTGHLAHMRYHEFFRVEDGKVTEMQAIWD
ncbi:MAG: ester cyclase, partial [Alphaproteobacteria bacterium]|nr:ester cyclase [Alphaproteobacteria bacterium]